MRSNARGIQFRHVFARANNRITSGLSLIGDALDLLHVRCAVSMVIRKRNALYHLSTTGSKRFMKSARVAEPTYCQNTFALKPFDRTYFLKRTSQPDRVMLRLNPCSFWIVTLDARSNLCQFFRVHLIGPGSHDNVGASERAQRQYFHWPGQRWLQRAVF